MNHQYHRQNLIASESEHPYVVQALALLDRAEQAILDLVEHRITIEKYVEEITEYDRYIWAKWHELPQKSNPINVGQNKKYSSWREQKWAPIYELVRQQMAQVWQTDRLVVIQNRPVVETVYSNGYIALKDVDGGIGVEHAINGRKLLLPIIAVEDKGGHACSTCFNGVNAQGLRLHQSFPEAKHVFITDNNVSVGQKKGFEIADHINLIVCERGQNRQAESYPALDATRFRMVHDGFIERLSQTPLETFTKYVTISSSHTETLRERIDQDHVVWNW